MKERSLRMAKIRPLGDRVLVKPLETEVKTKSGIVLPDSAKEKSNEAEVIAVGPGKYDDGKLIAPEVKVGDRVIYKESWGSKVKIDGDEYELLDSDSILGVIEK
jgi:chaperonin GroES